MIKSLGHVHLQYCAAYLTEIGSDPGVHYEEDHTIEHGSQSRNEWDSR